jgi:hypothetical protein
MGRLGGFADLNLGTPPLLPLSNPLGERCSAYPAAEPDRSSVNDVINGGAVNVNAVWSKPPVEDAMGIDGRWRGIEREA